MVWWNRQVFWGFVFARWPKWHVLCFGACGRSTIPSLPRCSAPTTVYLQHTPSKPRNPLSRPASHTSLPLYRAFVRRTPSISRSPLQVHPRSRVCSKPLKGSRPRLTRTFPANYLVRLQTVNNQDPSPTRKVLSVRKSKTPQSRASVLQNPPLAQLRPQRSSAVQSSSKSGPTIFSVWGVTAAVCT